MRKVTICAWVLLMALMLMVPLAIAEDSGQPVVDNPVTIETPADENQTGSSIEEVIPEIAEESSLFFTVNLDAELNSYAPQAILEQIKDGNIEGDTLLEKINELYKPNIDFDLADSMDDSWVLIDEDTTFAVGDILVSEDFAEVGILVAEDEVYDLDSETVQTPADYEYYNRDLHEVNYDFALAAANNEPEADVDLDGSEVIINTESDESLPEIENDPSINTPAETEEPTIDPTVEEPATEEPIVEEPAIEEIIDPAADTTVEPAIEPTAEAAAVTTPVVEPLPEPTAVPSLPYFSVVLHDEDFRSYCPMNVSGQIEDGEFAGATLIEQLQGLYAKGIEFVASDSVDSGWEEIGDDTRYILADILVNADFSKVGIWINKDQVFCLNDQTVYTPSEFMYYNRAFQSKTIQEVW